MAIDSIYHSIWKYTYLFALKSKILINLYLVNLVFIYGPLITIKLTGNYSIFLIK